LKVQGAPAVRFSTVRFHGHFHSTCHARPHERPLGSAPTVTTPRHAPIRHDRSLPEPTARNGTWPMNAPANTIGPIEQPAQSGLKAVVPQTIDLTAMKTGQQGAWSSSDRANARLLFRSSEKSRARSRTMCASARGATRNRNSRNRVHLLRPGERPHHGNVRPIARGLT